MDEVEVRRASTKQAKVIAKLNDYVHQMHVEAVPSFFKKKTLQEANEIFERILAIENAYAFIAWHKKTPVGYTLCFVQYREETPFTYARRFIVIDQISVNPQWSGKGIGRSLFNAILEVAEQHQIKEIDATTWSFNESARAFFETCGFKPQLKRLSLSLIE
ncbi:MAG: GNAT family N-acetyltransferase [Chloroflexota bacterium]